MSAFYKDIAGKITVPYKRLSIIRNPDGFLQEPSVQRALTAEAGILFVTGTSIQLRFHFETAFADAPEARFCYLCDNPAMLLPDIREEAFLDTFSVTDLFPNISDKKTISSQSAAVLEALFAKDIQGYVSSSDLARFLMEIEFASCMAPAPAAAPVAELSSIMPDWASLTSVVEAISAGVLDAIRKDEYDGIKPELTRLNGSFQALLDQSYFASLHSSHILGPKSVNKILPYLTHKHSLDDKVALLVVDGMAYWQYLVLQEKLKAADITPADSAIFAWIPTITMLSRQAIFRGDDPRLDYSQNPTSEKNLWNAWWTAKGIPSADIQYIYGDSEIDVWSTTRRLALVSVTLDEVMHISDRPDLLLAYTEAWARGFFKIIADLHQKGFAVYITTDHGNILSTGTGSLTSAEKTHLFADGSRGARHLIYDSSAPMESFLAEHDASSFLVHDNWLAYRQEQAFAKTGKRQITHGGSHILEVAIPFIEIPV